LLSTADDATSVGCGQSGRRGDKSSAAADHPDFVFTLPFHVDSPLAVGVVCLAIAGLFAALLWSFERDIGPGRILKWYFARRFGAAGEEKSQRLGRVFLAGMLVAFGAASAFGLLVGTGLIKNGVPPKALTIEQFQELHRK
jgi:hypothetical protein